MSVSNRQEKNPYPKGVGVGSVPVLFTLRNVQPDIVNGIAKTNGTTVETQSSAGSTTSTKTSTTVATVAEQTASQASVPSRASVPPTTKNNRSFNVAVGVLVIALCLIVIRNTQGNKASSNSTMTSNSGQSNTSDAKTIAASRVENLPLATAKSHDLQPIELGQISFPAMATSNHIVTSLGAATTTTNPGLLPESISINEPKAFQEKTLNEQSFIHGKPALLEPSTKPMLLVESKPAADSTDLAMNTTQVGNLSIDSSNNLNASEGQVEVNDQLSVVPTIAETNEPTMATKDLIEVFSRVKTFAPLTTTSNGSISQEPVKQGVPTIAISNVAQRFDSTPSTAAIAPQSKPIGILSGQSYPPPTKEYMPLTIPAYEQDALGGRSGMASSTQASQMIRQPAPGSNRYPVYKPISQPQSGNSIGFPPNPPGN